MSNTVGMTIAYHSYHKPTYLCIACTANALNSTYYLLLDGQQKINSIRPEEAPFEKGDADCSIKVLESSCDNSMNYMLTRLQETDLPEFEAYLCVSRNLIEKISRLADVSKDKKNKIDSSMEFEKYYDDIKMLFDSREPNKDATTLKKIKWLGRGTNRKNINADNTDLVYAYLSRVLHVTNMDSLLQPKEDRFLVKAYMLLTISKLYHQYAGTSSIISDSIKKQHSRIYNRINIIWESKGLSIEQLIYMTTFYDDNRKKNELSALIRYSKTLNNAFETYTEQKINVLPKFDIIDPAI